MRDGRSTATSGDNRLTNFSSSSARSQRKLDEPSLYDSQIPVNHRCENINKYFLNTEFSFADKNNNK